jgi:hypothetical protein
MQLWVQCQDQSAVSVMRYRVDNLYSCRHTNIIKEMSYVEPSLVDSPKDQYAPLRRASVAQWCM